MLVILHSGYHLLSVSQGESVFLTFFFLETILYLSFGNKEGENWLDYIQVHEYIYTSYTFLVHILIIRYNDGFTAIVSWAQSSPPDT